MKTAFFLLPAVASAAYEGWPAVLKTDMAAVCEAKKADKATCEAAEMGGGKVVCAFADAKCAPIDTADAAAFGMAGSCDVVAKGKCANHGQEAAYGTFALCKVDGEKCVKNHATLDEAKAAYAAGKKAVEDQAAKDAADAKAAYDAWPAALKTGLEAKCSAEADKTKCEFMFGFGKPCHSDGAKCVPNLKDSGTRSNTARYGMNGLCDALVVDTDAKKAICTAYGKEAATGVAVLCKLNDAKDKCVAAHANIKAAQDAYTAGKKTVDDAKAAADKKAKEDAAAAAAAAEAAKVDVKDKMHADHVKAMTDKCAAATDDAACKKVGFCGTFVAKKGDTPASCPVSTLRGAWDKWVVHWCGQQTTKADCDKASSGCGTFVAADGGKAASCPALAFDVYAKNVNDNADVAADMPAEMKTAMSAACTASTTAEDCTKVGYCGTFVAAKADPKTDASCPALTTRKASDAYLTATCKTATAEGCPAKECTFTAAKGDAKATCAAKTLAQILDAYTPKKTVTVTGTATTAASKIPEKCKDAAAFKEDALCIGTKKAYEAGVCNAAKANLAAAANAANKDAVKCVAVTTFTLATAAGRRLAAKDATSSTEYTVTVTADKDGKVGALEIAALQTTMAAAAKALTAEAFGLVVKKAIEEAVTADAATLKDAGIVVGTVTATNAVSAVVDPAAKKDDTKTTADDKKTDTTQAAESFAWTNANVSLIFAMLAAKLLL